MVLRNQVATSTPTPTSASAAMSRTTSACERTRWRGETDTTTPASTPTCSFSSGVASGGTTASVLCTSFILPRRSPPTDDGGFRSAGQREAATTCDSRAVRSPTGIRARNLHGRLRCRGRHRRRGPGPRLGPVRVDAAPGRVRSWRPPDLGLPGLTNIRRPPPVPAVAAGDAWHADDRGRGRGRHLAAPARAGTCTAPRPAPARRPWSGASPPVRAAFRWPAGARRGMLPPTPSRGGATVTTIVARPRGSAPCLPSP